MMNNKLQYSKTIPTYDDYIYGEYYRYFANFSLENKIIEISKKDYDVITIKKLKFFHEFYTVVKLPWKLIGSTRSKTVGNIVIESVKEINRGTVARMDNEFPGLKNYILNYEEFVIYDDNII